VFVGVLSDLNGRYPPGSDVRERADPGRYKMASRWGARSIAEVTAYPLEMTGFPVDAIYINSYSQVRKIFRLLR